MKWRFRLAMGLLAVALAVVSGGHAQSVTTPVETAFASLGNHLVIAYGYDPASANPWKAYDPTAPSFASQLREVEPLGGYFVYVDEDVTYTVGNQSRQLREGWNLVGWPGVVSTGPGLPALPPAPTATPTPGPTPTVEYPPGYYLGPLIETHLHLGTNVPSLTASNIDAFVDLLDRHNIQRAILFAGLGGSAAREVRGVITSRYAHRFVLFGSLGAGNPAEVTPERVRDTLNEGIYRGIGEIPLYQPQWQGITPNDPVFQRIYPVLAEYEVPIMFHPSSPRGMEEAVRDYPDNLFLFHGFQTSTSVGELMDTYPNVYFTINNIVSPEQIERPGPGLLFATESAEEFVSILEREFNSRLEAAVSIFKAIIEAHPDGFMWGTDLVEPWHFEQQVVDELVKYGRAFLGRLDPQVAEKVAYKNAQTFLFLISGHSDTMPRLTRFGNRTYMLVSNGFSNGSAVCQIMNCAWADSSTGIGPRSLLTKRGWMCN